MAPGPATMPTVGKAVFDPRDPPRILHTMIEVVREEDGQLGEDTVVHRTLTRLSGRVELDDVRGGYISLIAVGWLQRFPVDQPWRHGVTLGPTARLLDLELEHELAYWVGNMDRRGRGERLAWPMP